MRRGRALVATVVTLVVVAAAAVVADYALRVTAEERLAASLGSSLGADRGVDVTISERRPFLLQLAGGHLDDVTAAADHLALDGTDVTGAHLHATGVAVRRPYSAQAVTLTGTVPTATIRQRIAQKGLDVDVAVVGQDLRASGTVLGVPWEVTLLPAANGGRLTVDATGADVAGLAVDVGALPAAVKDALTGIDVPVAGLPQGLAITGARVVADGVEVTAAGQDVVLPG